MMPTFSLQCLSYKIQFLTVYFYLQSYNANNMGSLSQYRYLTLKLQTIYLHLPSSHRKGLVVHEDYMIRYTLFRNG